MISKLSPPEFNRLRRLSQDGIPDAKLMELFCISRSTVERYKYESIREISRRVQRNRYKQEKSCYKCGGSLKDHPKCLVCEILIHGNEQYCESHKP